MVAGFPLLAGLFLSIAVMAGTLALASLYPAETFPSIAYACSLNGLTPGDCQSQAREAGLFSLGAYLAVLAAIVWRKWFSATSPAAVSEFKTEPSHILFVAGALALFCLHTGLIEFGPVHVSRLVQTEHYSNLISLENLLLPVLLQLYVLTPHKSPLRAPLLAALLIGLSLSPYRAMMMALFLFAMVIPFLTALWEEWRRVPGHRGWTALGRQAAVATVIGVTLLVAGIQDTKMRSPTLLAISLGLATLPPEHPLPANFDKAAKTDKSNRPSTEAADALDLPEKAGAAHDQLMPPANLIDRVVQRIVYPLYQSAIAAHLARTDTAMPSLLDQFLRKMRLSDAPNLEEFLFRRIYGGEGHGETTSLTYGEASVYFPAMPLLWLIAVPLMLVLAWRFFKRRGLDCSTLFGFALWRTSFSGLFPILPSLLIQIATLWMLHHIPMRALRRMANLTLNTALASALALTAYSLTLQVLGHRDILYASFELERGCWLESPSWVPKVVGSVAAAHGLPMQAVLPAHHRSALVLALPYGEAAIPLLDEMRGAIASLSYCQQAPDVTAAPSAIKILDHHVVNRDPAILNLIIIVALGMALFTPFYRRTRRTGGRE